MPEYKNPGKLEFTGLIKSAGGGGAYVEFPFNVQPLFGVGGRVPIKVNFEGIQYRGSLAKMGTDCHIVPILKDIRTKLKKGTGDRVKVELELDVEERKVDLADDVICKLKKYKAAQLAWEQLSYTCQREYHKWIEEAKRQETREKRISQMLEQLRAK